MSEEVKFEYLIGDEQKFKEATDVVVAIIQYGENDFCWLTDINEVPSVDGNLIALRRIMHTPIWARADWKAGMLPEVGGECRHCQSKLVKSVIAVTATHIVIDANNGVDPDVLRHDEFMQYYVPIETQEEKAARLEEEFVDSMIDDIHPKSNITAHSIEIVARAAYRKIMNQKTPAKDGE
ncbi:hypothetical protein [uncultured Tolumonas sp.]|uniref:hypothetical protein n=1 Tax=uncultured Tolumonas sp. TaxID=263765 RepID=UPI002A0A581F|nr:hypothetical protein [uncultured Tolumonas sp.]